jgi:3-hydroxy acid dehydrogenase / malonic semialdehyde reductase
MKTPPTVFVTGATSGIGRACAEVFSEAGARVIATGRRAHRLEELAASLPGPCRTLQLDVRDADDVAAQVAGLDGEFAEIDVLVNNAGMAIGRDGLHEMSPGDSAAVIETNVIGALNVIHAILPSMVARGRGHVVSIGSNAARDVYPGGAVYCASKAALDRITKGMRMDVLGTGVRVSTVDPGMVRTEFNDHRMGDPEAAAEVYRGMTPLTPRDIADIVAWVVGRPDHVQVAEVLVYATDQAGHGQIARRGGGS